MCVESYDEYALVFAYYQLTDYLKRYRSLIPLAMQLGFSRAIDSRELDDRHPSGQTFGVRRGSQAAQGFRILGRRALKYRSS